MTVTPFEEFDCMECGRHITRFPGTNYPRFCAKCLHIPGWFHDDDLRKILAPHMEAPDAKE